MIGALISNGRPARLALCWYNAKARYIMFKIVVPDIPQATAEFLVKPVVSLSDAA